MLKEEVRKALMENSDTSYRDFSAKLIPNVDIDMLIGVRSPKIKEIAKAINKANVEEYLADAYFDYHEERLLYGLVISTSKLPLDTKFYYYDIWLKYADNWAVTDSTLMGVKDFLKPINREKVYNFWVSKLAETYKTYVVRSVIVVLFRYFMTDEYVDKVIEVFKSIKCGEYYVDMALSWGICELLIKYYDKGVALLNEGNLPKFVHNKAIQKAIESFRITDENKSYLRSIKK